MFLSVFGLLFIWLYMDHIWECVLYDRYNTIKFSYFFKYIISKGLEVWKFDRKIFDIYII